MAGERVPTPEARPISVPVLFLVFMFCWPYAIFLAWQSGYFKRDGKTDPLMIGFAVVAAALVLFMLVAILLDL